MRGRNWQAIVEFNLTMPTQPLVRILVIDDEPIVRLEAREILEDAGYVVKEAASADEALPVLADGATTEAILTDIDMPGTLDGLQLARIVDGLMPEIAIVIMSGHELPRAKTCRSRRPSWPSRSRHRCCCSGWRRPLWKSRSTCDASMPGGYRGRSGNEKTICE